MGDKSRIEWTDATWNPVVGCSKVSPGCDNCYAIPMSGRIEAMGNQAYEGLTAWEISEDGSKTIEWTNKIRCLPERLNQPLRWQRPRRVFVNSMSDLFHPDVDNAFIVEVWIVMALAQRHQFQVLTKRPQRMAKLLADPHFHKELNYGLEYLIDENEDNALGDDAFAARYEREWPYDNIWLGTSIESDKYTFRARRLAQAPAAVRFLSLEPLLGDLPSLDLEDIDWVIVGGESGPGARWCHPAWVRAIREQCIEAGIPFFFKQWGAWKPLYTYSGEAVAGFDNVGKKAAGRELDGRTWDEYPEVVPA